MLVAESGLALQLESAGVQREAVANSALALFDAARGFVPRSKAKGARRYSAQVLLDEVEVLIARPGGTAVAQVALEIELAPEEGEETLREEGRAAEPAAESPVGVREALLRATTAALARAVDSLALDLADRARSVKELVGDLVAKEATVREHAVAALGRRGDRQAVPALMARLSDPDPAVVERAVGALDELRDPRSVPALIELARHREGAYLAGLARILGDIGGPEARAWLLTMASGHPDEAVRAAAAAALSDMSARAKGSSPSR